MLAGLSSAVHFATTPCRVSNSLDHLVIAYPKPPRPWVIIGTIGESTFSLDVVRGLVDDPADRCNVDQLPGAAERGSGGRSILGLGEPPQNAGASTGEGGAGSDPPRQRRRLRRPTRTTPSTPRPMAGRGDHGQTSGDALMHRRTRHKGGTEGIEGRTCHHGDSGQLASGLMRGDLQGPGDECRVCGHALDGIRIAHCSVVDDDRLVHDAPADTHPVDRPISLRKTSWIGIARSGFTMLAKSIVIAVLAQGATKGRASRSIPEGVTSYESPGWNRWVHRFPG